MAAPIAASHNRALVDLAVAEQNEGAVAALAHACGKRKADTDRQAVSKCAGRRLDARHHSVFGMSAQNAVGAAEAVELRQGKEAAIGQQRIERQTPVPLAEDRAVAGRIARVVRIDPQHVVVEYADHFDQRQCRTDMSASRGADRTEDQSAQIKATLVQRAGEGGFSVGRDLGHFGKSVGLIVW
ncbi:hypothetical protein ACVWW3_003212 [Bradyrhizobium sp. LM2.9]